MNKEKTEEKKEACLIKLIEYLRDNNEYYKQFIKSDINIVNKDSLTNFPFITKQDIASNINEILTNDGEELFYELTSGTTGNPFRCYKTQKERVLLAIVEWKERRKWDSEVRPELFFQLMGVNIKYGLDFSDFSDSNIIKIFSILDKSKATWLCGSPTTIYYYGKKIEKGIVHRIDRIKYIELQGEYCDEITRKYIEEQFKAKTIVHYGNRECWAIAYECKCGNLHVVDNILAESKKDNGTDTIVITNLICKKMPFVRYCTNDIGRVIKKSTCNCGNTAPILILEGGRRASTVYGYDVIGDIAFKKIVHNVINSKERRDKDIIRRFRIEQNSLKEFTYYFDVGDFYNEQYEKEISSETKKLFDDDVKINFSYENGMNGAKYRIFTPWNG